VPFFVEVAQMPRTFGRNQIHASQVVGWCEADYPLVESEPPGPDDADDRIGDLVAERIPNGATLQSGIGATPTAVLRRLADHRDLGIHTEVLSDPVIDLVEQGVVTGVHKVRRPSKVVATFALGTSASTASRRAPRRGALPVDWVNDRDHRPTAVDGIDQRHDRSRLLGPVRGRPSSRYWSGSGG
jgi:acyl-CoA hydrolase